MVQLNKHAHSGDRAITNKTGGGNSEANVVERMVAYKPKSKDKGNLSDQRETGGAVLTTKPIRQLV